MTKLEPIRREPANEAVYSALRQGILTSLMRPGERLDVNELASQLGVSPTPVRNAIHRLSAEGLIEVRPRSGTFVARVNASDVRETFEIRRALECLAAEKASQQITPEELADLRDLLALLSQPVDEEIDLRRHGQHNARFHMAILQAARSERLISSYEQLNAHIQIARIHAAEPTPVGDDAWRSRLSSERVEHREIVSALSARDAVRAVRAMRTHIDRACESLVSALDRKNNNSNDKKS